MARTLLHHQKAGLQQFILKDGFSSVGLADVTAIQVDVGAVTVFSTAHDSGPVRWNTSETRMGEIMALVPMVSFTSNNEVATITITSPTYPGGLAWASKSIAVGEGSFMAAAGVYYDQCDSCGIWFPVDQLIRQLKIREVRPAANYLPWSRFNDNGWQVDTYELGEVSMGRSRWFHKIHPYAGSMVAGGAASFWGDGEIEAVDTVDLTTFTTALLRGEFGTHQTTKNPWLTVEFGVYHTQEFPKILSRYSFGTLTGVEGRTAWVINDLAAIDPAHLDALTPFYKVTTHDDQQIWWGEGFRLQKDVIEPGMTTVETSGAAKIQEFNAAFLGSGVACEECYDVLKKRVNEYSPTVDPFEIVDVEDQEL